MDDSAKRLSLIVEPIDLTQSDVTTCDEATYYADRRLADATALRVMHIGKNTARIDPAMKARHPGLPWRDMAATRNVVAHDYARINHALICRAVVEYLDELRTMCVAELAMPEQQGE